MLTFPNRSRSFDEARAGVRFIGYDGMLEVSVLVKAAALEEKGHQRHRKHPTSAFDASRDRVSDAAHKIYSRTSERM